MKSLIKKPTFLITCIFCALATTQASATQYELEFGKWQLIALPDTLPSDANTPNSIFGDEIFEENPLAEYGQDWIMFSFNVAANDYDIVGQDDPVETNIGYWINQRVSDNLILNAESALDPEISSKLCALFEVSNVSPPDSFDCPTSANKLAFVTDTVIRGDEISSLGNADRICQVEAEAAGLNGHFMAWLGMDTHSITERFSFSTGSSYQKPSGTIIVDDVKVLKGPRNVNDDILRNPLNENAFGVTHSTVLSAWSGTNFIGAGVASDCLEWSGNTDTVGFTQFIGAYGDITRTDGNWITGNPIDQGLCDLEKRLYCFQQ